MFIHLYKKIKSDFYFLFINYEPTRNPPQYPHQDGLEAVRKKYTHLNYDPKRKYRHIMFGGVDLAVFSYSLRQLVSLESGLWQFCAEKGFLNSPDQYPNKDFRAKNPRPYGEMSLRWDTYYKTEVYQYRLLESALIPEEELGRFLIENIKVEGK